MSHTMDCTSIITWENLFRSSVRAESAWCATAVVDDGDFINTAVECDDVVPLLTGYAMAIPDEKWLISFSDGEIAQPTCEELVNIPTETLLNMVLYVSDGGARIIQVVEEISDTDDGCEHSCTGAELSTDELIRRTFVKVPDLNDTWAIRIIRSEPSDPLDCDLTEITTETLIRASIVERTDGGYAWRIAINP